MAGTVAALKQCKAQYGRHGGGAVVPLAAPVHWITQSLFRGELLPFQWIAGLDTYKAPL